MSYIVLTGVVPHPPIMVSEIGNGEEQKISSTIRAMDVLAGRVKKAEPDFLVIISPHGSVFRDGVAVNASPKLEGNLGRFGAPQVSFCYDNDLFFVDLLVSEAKEAGITTIALDNRLARDYDITNHLDHGVTVPMYFLDKAGIKLPVVVISMSLLPPPQLYAFGTALQKAARKYDRRVAVLASGDLSHRLTRNAPGGYAPEGEILDQEIVRAIRESDVEALIKLDPLLAEKGGECGWRSILMMLGSLDGLEITSEVLSYEGTFGVGYMVAVILPGTQCESRNLLEELRAEQGAKSQTEKEDESLYVKLARETLEEYIGTGKKPSPAKDMPSEFEQRAGVFVSIKKHGQLRGCIGTILPTTDNLAQEIISNAISAGTGDPRFSPIQEYELKDLSISVDILREPEPISDLKELDPQRYGVIVRKGRRTGLLLPNLEGIDTAEEQVAIARQKAGIGPTEEVQLERFEVIRYY